VSNKTHAIQAPGKIQLQIWTKNIAKLDWQNPSIGESFSEVLDRSYLDNPLILPIFCFEAYSKPQQTFNHRLVQFP